MGCKELCTKQSFEEYVQRGTTSSMPLALTDPRWNELQSSYGDTTDVVAWLTGGYATGLPAERLGDLVNEVQHQGGTCTAMYAVAPHSSN